MIQQFIPDPKKGFIGRADETLSWILSLNHEVPATLSLKTGYSAMLDWEIGKDLNDLTQDSSASVVFLQPACFLTKNFSHHQ
jgi:hypothetical protein